MNVFIGVFLSLDNNTFKALFIFGTVLKKGLFLLLSFINYFSWCFEVCFVFEVHNITFVSKTKHRGKTLRK